MGRAPCCDKANVKRGPWSPEEDALLKSYLQKHGTGGNWIALPLKAGLKRCGKSCRLRWLNYLRPDIKHGGFTEQEDQIIFSLYNNIGSRWSVIASHLPGRTDNDVKNYWNTKLKKKLMIPSCITAPPPPLPPPPPPPTTTTAATATVTATSYSFMKTDQTHDNYDHYNELFMGSSSYGFVPSELMQGLSPAEDFSAASSSSVITMDSNSNNSGYLNWSSNSAGVCVDDVLLTEFGFGSSFSEFLCGYNSYSERFEDMTLSYYHTSKERPFNHLH